MLHRIVCIESSNSQHNIYALLNTIHNTVWCWEWWIIITISLWCWEAPVFCARLGWAAREYLPSEWRLPRPTEYPLTQSSDNVYTSYTLCQFIDRCCVFALANKSYLECDKHRGVYNTIFVWINNISFIFLNTGHILFMLNKHQPCELFLWMVFNNHCYWTFCSYL